MKNGIMTIDNSNIKTVYIDREAVEFARLNKRTQDHISNIENAKADAERNHRKAESKRKKFEDFTLKTLLSVVFGMFGTIAIIMAGVAGMIAPVIWIPVAIAWLCLISIKIGVWFGRAVEQ